MMLKRPKNTEIFFLLLIAGMAIALLGLRAFDLVGYLGDSTLFDDDLRQHLLPFYADQHPHQFQDGFLSDYASAYLPAGYKLLFQAGMQWITPLQASKQLGAFLLLCSFVFLFLCGKTIGGKTGGWSAVLLGCLSPFLLLQTYAGLYRSFSFPLLFSFLFCWYQKRIVWMGLLVIIQTLFYPPLSLVCWLAFSLGHFLPRIKIIKSAWKEYALWSVVTILMGISLVMTSNKPDWMGPVVTIEMAERMPEWHQHGRIEDLPFPSIITSIKKGVLKTVCFAEFMETQCFIAPWKVGAYLILLAGLFLLAIKQWKLASPLIMLVISGLLFFIIARLKAFQLGFPNRFLDYPIIAAALLLWPAAWNWIQAETKPTKYRLLYFSGIAAVLLTFPPVIPLFQKQALSVSKYEDLLHHINDNEEIMLIAGWPESPNDDIPLFSQKEIFIDYEHAHPLYLDYYNQIRIRLIDLIRLTFTTNASQAAAIRDQYGLSHLLVKKSHFSKNRRSPDLFAPYNDLVSFYRKHHQEQDFLFNSPPDYWIDFENDIYLVVDLSALPSQPRQAQPPQPVPLATWHQTIALHDLKFNLSQQRTISLSFSWQISPVENVRRWTVFVHLVHEETGYRFFGDHPLLTGIPEETIQGQNRKEIFFYSKSISVPPKAPSGIYRVEMGITHASHGDRLIRTDVGSLSETVYRHTARLILP